MKWLDDLRVFLDGKKTYLSAIGYAVDSYGVQMGWWEEASFRTILEQVLTVFFLRQGITKSGPVEVK
jgi:hypothetical protein